MNTLTKKELTLSQLIEDLSNGLTWLTKDDIGMGSIQEKYNGNEVQMRTIQKHPELINITPATIQFIIIDDLKKEKETINLKKAEIVKTKVEEPVLQEKLEKTTSNELFFEKEDLNTFLSL